MIASRNASTHLTEFTRNVYKGTHMIPPRGQRVDKFAFRDPTNSQKRKVRQRRERENEGGTIGSDHGENILEMQKQMTRLEKTRKIWQQAVMWSGMYISWADELLRAISKVSIHI